MAQAEAGDLGAAAQIARRDELGRLAASFNRMRRKIQQGYEDKVGLMARIEYFSRELQAEVERATHELAARHEELRQAHTQFFELQRQLSRTERLAMGGQWAAMMAHDLSTPLSPETVVIMMTAFGSIETAIETIQQGAYDYISNPLKLNDVKLTVRRALAETLLESELFGHIKGAFTGAIANKKGLLEAANGGTCFLDEIGDIRPSLQARLLRFIQERQIRRVGGREEIKLDVRVIAATNKSLKMLITDGMFREDQFYRLSVVSITLPPRRDRQEDIALLAEYFLTKYTLRNQKNISHISPQSMNLLSAYLWPGNVRELGHVIEQAVALTTNPVLLPEDLPPEFQQATAASHDT